MPAPMLSVEPLVRLWKGIVAGERLDERTLADMARSAADILEAQASSESITLSQAPKVEDYPFVHTLNVAVLSADLAKAIGWDRARQEEVAAAALLMDVGKLLLPQEILTKSGRLSDLEFEAIREHPADGARLLLAARAPDLAVAVAYEHHMRHDGGGYPDPGRASLDWKPAMASALCQIADCFDALRMHSPYHTGKDGVRVASVMRVETGRRFDPVLLDIFLDRISPKIAATRASLAALAAAAG